MSLTLGTKFETQALHYLQSQGLSLVLRNYRCRFGEIDLIMRDSRTLIFIEVRARKYRQFGGAIESVQSQKQRRIILTAQYYLSCNLIQTACRFDVIAFENSSDQKAPTWIKNAFAADYLPH